MYVFDLTGSENHPVYQELQISNGDRQYDFLRSIVTASIQLNRGFLSQTLLKSLNFHAITCLHSYAGEFRPGEVRVGDHVPAPCYRVPALMEDFVNEVNASWSTADPVVLATHVLWKLNYIHPFINGNGRTARAACYFVLCVKAGGWLPGEPILPELLKQNRDEYCAALVAADQSLAAGQVNYSLLHALVSRLLDQQLNAVENGGANGAAAPAPEPATGA